MEYENPCKEMMWFYVDQKNKDRNDYWNYTGEIKNLYNSDMIDMIDINVDNNITQFIKKLTKGHSVWSLNSTDFNRVKLYVETEMNKPFTNPFLRSALNFNGQCRFDMEGDRSNLIEPTLFMNKPVVNGLNMKSFSRITELTHMGYLNMSGAIDMRLDYELDMNSVDGEINIVTNTYQIIRIASGFGTALWR